MIVQVYKISVWEKSERLAEIECKIYTDDIDQSIRDLKEIDFGIPVTKDTRYNLRYIERPDIDTMPEMKIGWINKAKITWQEREGLETKQK